MSDCGKYLIVSIVKACRDNLLYFADLEKNGEITGKISLTPVVTEFKADYDVNTNSIKKSLLNCIKLNEWTLMFYVNFQYITNIASKMVFRTNHNAPNYRLIVIDLNNHTEENWSTLIEVTKSNLIFQSEKERENNAKNHSI